MSKQEIVNASTPASGSGWRLLKDGEMRELGDQIWYEGMGWTPIINGDIGRQNTDGFYVLPVRRKLTPNAELSDRRANNP